MTAQRQGRRAGAQYRDNIADEPSGKRHWPKSMLTHKTKPSGAVQFEEGSDQRVRLSVAPIRTKLHPEHQKVLLWFGSVIRL
jgi:hypothetical protein